MSSRIYIEGGGDSRELRTRCREGFRKLLEACGFERLPRLVACGGRAATFDAFRTAHSNAEKGDYIALLVDSEEPVANMDQPWIHLNIRDSFEKLADAEDDQVLLMTTCMETWIVADRQALRKHYSSRLRENRLPAFHDLESISRHAVMTALRAATCDCGRQYAKGAESFKLIGRLDPAELRKHLPSFIRVSEILERRL